eukprot:2067681-Pyramimonas_sp.AAC.1
MQGDVFLFSGCKDEQTSADVSFTVGAFKLPADAGPGGAGGACTNALLEVRLQALLYALGGPKPPSF